MSDRVSVWHSLNVMLNLQQTLDSVLWLQQHKDIQSGFVCNKSRYRLLTLVIVTIVYDSLLGMVNSCWRNSHLKWMHAFEFPFIVFIFTFLNFYFSLWMIFGGISVHTLFKGLENRNTFSNNFSAIWIIAYYY